MESLQPAVGPLVPLSSARYERHRPEATLLYELVAQHYPAFIEALGEEGRSLPAHMQQEFEAYLTGDELGAAAEARLRHRDRDLRAVRGQGEGHRQHRGPGGDREDPRAPGRPGAAGRVEAAVAGATPRRA